MVIFRVELFIYQRLMILTQQWMEAESVGAFSPVIRPTNFRTFQATITSLKPRRNLRSRGGYPSWMFSYFLWKIQLTFWDFLGLSLAHFGQLMKLDGYHRNLSQFFHTKIPSMHYVFVGIYIYIHIRITHITLSQKKTLNTKTIKMRWWRLFRHFGFGLLC